MPVVTHYEPTQPFEILEQTVTNHNFVIHEASEMPGFPVHQIENMIVLVTFLNKNGEPNQERTRIWVSGNLMNDLICHKLKKYKFVYPSKHLNQRNALIKALIRALTKLLDSSSSFV